MQFSTLTFQLVALFTATSHAWMLTAFEKGHGCRPEESPRTRVLSGAPDLARCFTFDEDMPGTGCVENFLGGQRGCVTGSLLPKSVRVHATSCKIYLEPGCKGYVSVTTPGNWCSSGWGHNIRSFSCSG